MHHRRNELLLVNKPTIVRQGTTAGGLEDEKIKKFATAIVEFGKVSLCLSLFCLSYLSACECDGVCLMSRVSSWCTWALPRHLCSIQNNTTAKTIHRIEILIVLYQIIWWQQRSCKLLLAFVYLRLKEISHQTKERNLYLVIYVTIIPIAAMAGFSLGV